MTDLDIEERYLRDELAALQESYAKAVKPIIDKLVAIHCRKPPDPTLILKMINELEQKKELGIAP